MFDLILKNIRKHISLTKEEEKHFTSKLVAETYNKKDFVLKPGQVAVYTHFINKGCLKLYQYDKNGYENIISFAPEDWWISDMHSFHSQEPATHCLQALEKTELLKISKNELENLFIEIPKFERFFRILQQNAYVALSKRINNKMSLTAEERYLKFKKRFPQVEPKITQKNIAAYLGITPEFVSKIIKKINSKR